MRTAFRVSAWVRPALCFALLACCVTAARAQYVRIPPPKDFNAEKKSAAMTMITSGSMTDKDTLKAYFLSLFSDMSNPDRARDMHRSRSQIKKQLQSAGNAATKATHTESNNLMLVALPTLIRNQKLHPAFRYNCALLLADLDSVERVGPTGPVTPLPAALDKMIELLGDEKAGDSVHLAALIGFSRHAENADDATKAKIAKATIAYLDRLEKSDASARKSDVKHWLEARAMEALGGTVTPTPEAVEAIQKRLADAGAPIWTRCAAAQSLGKFKYDANSKIDANTIFPHFKSLVETAVDQGLSRRELRYVLFSAKCGLVGHGETPEGSLSLLLTGDAKSQFTAMTNAAAAIAKICEDKNTPSVRVALLVSEVADKWRSGGFSGTEVSAEAKEALSEDQTEGEEPAEGAPAEGTEDADPGINPFGDL